MCFQHLILVISRAVFIGLKKVFLVNHYLLLDKLYAVGLSNCALLWFDSCLHNRKQCVILQGCESDLFFQQRGMPEGSKLGHFFSLFFINDFPLICFNSSVQLHTDNTAILTSKSNLSQIENALLSDFWHTICNFWCKVSFDQNNKPNKRQTVMTP